MAFTKITTFLWRSIHNLNKHSPHPEGCLLRAWRSQPLSMSLNKPQVLWKCSPPGQSLHGHSFLKFYSNAKTADCLTWQFQFLIKPYLTCLAATLCLALETEKNTKVRTVSHPVDQRKSLAEWAQCYDLVLWEEGAKSNFSSNRFATLQAYD